MGRASQGVVRKVALAVAVIGAATIAVVGTSQARPTAATGSSAEVGLNVTYRIVSPSNDEYMKWLADTFNNQNKGKIKVTLTGIPDNDFKPKIGLVLRSSSPPDVFFAWEAGWAKFMIDSGFAAPLDSYWQQYGWTKTLTPAASNIATMEGHKYMVPYYMSASVVWYNTDLYKKYKLSVPKTQTQLQHNNDVLKKAGVAPFLLANQQQWEAQFDWSAYFVNKYGAAAYDDLLNRKIAWTDPRVVAAFAQMKTMEDAGDFLKGVNSMDFDTTAIIFWKRQQAAQWYQGSFILSKFLKDKKLTYPVDWFPYPKIGTQKPSMSVFAESTWMMAKRSQHKAEAAKFLNWVISRQAQEKMVATDGPFAANRTVTPELADEPPMVQRLGKAIAKYSGISFTHPDHALGPAVSQPFLEQLQAVLAGTTTAAKAAAVTEKAAKRSQGAVKA
jgi:raffinose/stachyose/melibiose transport system substrate-binding protein